MKKAIIIYQSRTGTTALYANKLKQFLNNKSIHTISMPVDVCKATDLSSFDYVFLGCWTKGLMIINQHPGKEWMKLARSLRFSGKSKIVLFTSYKIMTGSMFPRMRKCLACDEISLELKSKDGNLDFSDENLLENFLHESGGFSNRTKPCVSTSVYEKQIAQN
jgi:flavodoxin